MSASAISTIRIACVAVPDLALQALVRAAPELGALPLVLVDGTAVNARVLAASAVARRAGVCAGMTASQARTLLPELVVRPSRPAESESARAALDDAALGFAPRVERDADAHTLARGGAVLLEAGDLGRLYPTEREVALALRARAAALGLDARVGIASSKAVARLAAWSRLPGSSDLVVVPPGGEAAFVARLPVSDLGPSPDAAAALHRFGLRTAGELAALPPGELALRLGPEGARLARLASGGAALGGEPLQPRAPADTLEEAMALDFAVADLEALAFVLRGLVDRVLDRLGARQLACAGLVLRLELESRAHDVREVPLGAPTREAATLLELLRLAVARRPPDAAVVGVTLAAQAARARTAQLDLFRAAGPAPDRLAQAVARLEALVGDVVGSPRAVDTHREEAITVAPYAPPPAGVDARRFPPARDGAGASYGARPPRARATDGAPPPRIGATGVREDLDGGGATAARADGEAAPARTDGAAGALALRRFRPPRPVEVLLDGGCVPRALSGVGLSAQVAIAAGPYRRSGEWWASGGFARDYWDAHASDGTLYRLSCDAQGAWRIEGYYD